MKQRETRHKVLLRARLRSGSAWSDVCIVNISSRGLGLQTAAPPARGTYVEVCKGHHIIIGRVVWTSSHRFGIRTQDQIDPLDVANSNEAAAGGADSAGRGPVERRRSPRNHQQQAETSRFAARAMQFASLAVTGAGAAFLLATVVKAALSAPLAAINAALAVSGAQ